MCEGEGCGTRDQSVCRMDLWSVRLWFFKVGPEVQPTPLLATMTATHRIIREVTHEHWRRNRNPLCHRTGKRFSHDSAIHRLSGEPRWSTPGSDPPVRREKCADCRAV